MDDCIFCKIIEGKIPSSKVYEDADCIAILDIFPVTWGHTLVISKKHYQTLLDTPENFCGRIIEPVKKVAQAIVKATRSDGFNLVQNNHKAASQLVPHLHFHIIPRKLDDGIAFQWKQKEYPAGEKEKMTELIRKKIQNPSI